METLPLLRCAMGSTVVPGDRLGRTITSSTNGNGRVRLVAGPGTYSRGGQVFACVLGRLQTGSPGVERQPTTQASDTITELPIVEISVVPAEGFKATDLVLRQAQIVLGQVARISTQQIFVDIVANEHGMLPEACAGCIRREDVKSGVQSDSSSMILTQSFRPGDFIIARVLSLGDPRRYFLSTAEPSLGVIHAVSSVSGKPMLPKSWKEMECTDTGATEARKCARPPKLPSDTTDSTKTSQQQLASVEIGSPSHEG